jgi:molybdenum cofactor cytidylyltransferase
MQGLLLAAGRGERFGGNKLLHPLDDGTPVALASARNLMAALDDVLAVVNGEDPELIALLERAGVVVTVCPDADRGMGTSLAWGAAQSRQADGWLVALADMPWIAPQTMRAVARALTDPSLIAAAALRGRRGHPVAFGRAYGAQLMALTGDQGARRLLERHAGRLVLVACEDTGILRDIDRREDLARR